MIRKNERNDIHEKIIVMIVMAVMGGAAWFFLLRPETISQKTLTQDFEAHRQAYEDVGYCAASPFGKTSAGNAIS